MKTRVKKVASVIGAAALMAFAGIQFVPVARANPPITADFAGPENVKAILDTSCYDCHSNATKWPWYSYVAPVSWLVARDVREGREHLNFSAWESMAQGEKAEAIEEIVEETSEGGMPMPIYLVIHPGARISDDKLGILRAWAAGAGPATERGESEEEEDDDR